ncbi:MAG: hypothetical protein ACLQUY_14270 [Ktedonobacterales bacterium]
MTSPKSEQLHALPAPVAITLWIYSRLLVLHPPVFRRDFSTGIIQVFRQICLDTYRRNGTAGIIRLWPAALGDLLRGALAEHAALLHIMRESPMETRYRRSTSMIFACFIAFVIAGIGFDKLSEDIMKSALPAAHPIMAVAYHAVMIGAVLALLAVLAGGIPLLLAALRFAVDHGRRDILARFAVPPVALAVTILYLTLIVRLNVGGDTVATIHTWQRIVGVGSAVLIFLIAAVASTAAVLDAFSRSEVPERLLRFSLIPGAVAILAMLATLVASLVWSVALWQYAPGHFFGNDGFLASSTLFATVLQASVMVLAVAVAALALSQGLGTRHGAANRAAGSAGG